MVRCLALFILPTDLEQASVLKRYSMKNLAKRILHANVNVMSHIYWFKTKVYMLLNPTRDWLNDAVAAASAEFADDFS